MCLLVGPAVQIGRPMSRRHSELLITQNGPCPNFSKRETMTNFAELSALRRPARRNVFWRASIGTNPQSVQSQTSKITRSYVVESVQSNFSRESCAPELDVYVELVVKTAPSPMLVVEEYDRISALLHFSAKQLFTIRCKYLRNSYLIF